MPYKRKKSNRIEWVAEVMRQGKRYYKVFAARKRRWMGGGNKIKNRRRLSTPTASWTLLDWANKYLEFAGSHFVKEVLDEKRRCFRLFLKAWTQCFLFISWIVQQFSNILWNRIRPDPVIQRIRTARTFGLHGNGDNVSCFPSNNPCDVAKFPEERQPRYVPPESDFWKVYEEAQGQDKLMLMGYVHLAARRSELYRLRWDDVNFAERTARLYTRKRKNGNWEYNDLPMTGKLYNALLLHKQNAHDEYVFVDPETNRPFTVRRQFMPGLCKRAGVKPFGLHAIRHLAASILADCNVLW